MIDNDRIGEELKDDLSRKVIDHRNRWRHNFISKYLETLTSVFKYSVKGVSSQEIELALRQGYGVAIGANRFGQIVVLGYTSLNSQLTRAGAFPSANRIRLKGSDLTLCVPEETLPAGFDNALEIWEADRGATGSFAMLYNKPVTFSSDVDMIKLYADSLAEIEASRFSIVIQSKVMTIVISEPEDATSDQMIKDIYNGNPFIKASESFDKDDSIVTFDNSAGSPTIETLKHEYQQKLSELNAFFGIDTLAVDKESGVSDLEAKGNEAYTKNNFSVYYQSRKHALDLLNLRYGLSLEVRV